MAAAAGPMWRSLRTQTLRSPTASPPWARVATTFSGRTNLYIIARRHAGADEEDDHPDFHPPGDVYPVEVADFGRLPPSLPGRAGDNMTCAGDYQQFRFWTGKVDLTPGTHTISAKVDPALWTDCYGQPGSVKPALFQALLNNIAGVGYTFGGQTLPVTVSPSVRAALLDFTVNWFTVQ